jgi:hypothetical protein
MVVLFHFPTFHPPTNYYFLTDFHISPSFLLLFSTYYANAASIESLNFEFVTMASSWFLKLLFKCLHHFAWYSYAYIPPFSFLNFLTYLHIICCMYKVVKMVCFLLVVPFGLSFKFQYKINKQNPSFLFPSFM